ncbi:MAG: tetratricopeptide repeat protein, partial [Candidatus Angelobacter sp.]
KALSINSHFPSSHFGIAADLMYMGKSSQAAAEMQKIVDEARDDGERRLGYFGLAVVASDNGKFSDALHAMDKEYAIAEKSHDDVSVAADLQAKGNIYAAMQNYNAATQQFDRSLKIVETSSADQQIKDNAKLLHHFNMAAIAIEKNDFAAAKPHMQAYRDGAQASKNPFQSRQAHELAGRLALAQKDYDAAISELGQANLQDPRNLYRLGQACEAQGDQAKAKSYFVQAAGFNSLPALNYAFIRAKAQKTLAQKKT